jgi:opacity protein-like surface antigen
MPINFGFTSLPVSRYLRSFGYNLRYTPKVGFGYELGLYLTKLKMPTQKAALIRDDGSAFKNATGADVIVDSPSSYIKTTDLYLGGLYNFKAVGDITPYVGLGYAKVKGNWHKSYYRGTPGRLTEVRLNLASKPLILKLLKASAWILCWLV